MNYKKLYLFGKKQSKGSFDDFYSKEKYDSLEKAYQANDYVKCDFVQGEDDLIYIEAKHVKNPKEKKYHRLNYQHCTIGIDALDDHLASEIAISLL